jgi:hypothetical protein
MLGYATFVVLLAGVAAPALGADTVASTRIEIDAAVVQAEANMQSVLNQFTSDAISATSLEELFAARDRANSDIAGIRDRAIATVDALVALYPDDLTADGASARSRIDSAASDAYVEIDDITAQVAPSLPPTSTTTTTTTTTTTVAPTTTTTTLAPTTTTTTTTTVPRTTTTTTEPTTTTTTIARDTTTTTVTSTTTTTTIAAVVAPPSTPPTDTSAAIDESVVYAIAPPPRFTGTLEAPTSVSEMLQPESGMVTAAFIEGMSVVVPPSVATAVLSLPIVLEILIGTIFTSVRSLVVPMAFLLVAVGILVWREMKLPGRGRSAVQPPM